MSTKDTSDLLDSVSGLIGTLIWPVLILFLVLRFRGQIGAVAEDLRATIQTREFSVKAGPGGS